MPGPPLQVRARRAADVLFRAGRLPAAPASSRAPSLRQRQRAVCTLLVTAGVLLAAAGGVGRSAVLVLVLVAQLVLALLGKRLLAAADRGAWFGIAAAVAAAAVLGVARQRPEAVLTAGLGLAVVAVIVTEVVRTAWGPAVEPGAQVSVEVGQGRVERLSQNLSLAVLAFAPALLLAVRVGVPRTPVPGRWWLAVGIAEVCAGVGIRLGGSIVRAGGLPLGDLLRRPHAVADLLRLPVARALGVDALVTVAAFAAALAGLAALGLTHPLAWVPALLAAVATPLVLAGATTVLGTRSPVAAGLLAVALGLAAVAPLAVLLSAHPG